MASQALPPNNRWSLVDMRLKRFSLLGVFPPPDPQLTHPERTARTTG
jgi:hypothetical protein